GEPEMNIEVQTDWVVGNPIIIKGFHHMNFENTGRVLQFVNQQIIQYSHLSSVSKLPDTIENHTLFTFLLTSGGQETLLTLKMENFPTETIFKHLDFYWQGTLSLLKDFVEKRR
ncbi:MAG TPA: SRPBCC domain-containing protein, partial [Sphingobacteriaceae bacterium]